MKNVRLLPIAICLSFYWSSTLFAIGPVTVYVNPMSADGGTGLKPTIDPTDPDRAFRQIKHVEAQNLNMNTLGIDSYTVICYSTQTELDPSTPFNFRYDTSPFSWSGWTYSSTKTVLITTRFPYDQHLGSMTDHGYKLIPTNIPGNMMSFADGNWRMEGLIAFSSGSNGSTFPSMLATAAMDTNATGYLLNNILGMQCDGGETECRGLFNTNTAVKTVIAANNIFFAPLLNNFSLAPGAKMLNQPAGGDGFPQAMGGDQSGLTLYSYSNTVAEGFFTGVEDAALTDSFVKNTVVQNTGNNAFAGCSAGSFNNISDDTTDCGADTVNNASVTFVNGHSAQDWRLSGLDTTAFKKCVSLSTDTVFAFIYDNGGGTRTATSLGVDLWDCGADERGTDRITLAGGGEPPAPSPVFNPVFRRREYQYIQ